MVLPSKNCPTACWTICIHGYYICRHKISIKGAHLCVPPEVDTNMLKAAVYDQIDPKITPVFEELLVQEGTGRVADADSSGHATLYR